MNIDVREGVKAYYGQTLQSSDDLLTNACCAVPPPDYLKPLLAKLHIEVVSRYYGCGLVLPQKLDGCSVLDLGCGAGRDCFLISALVGERGRVVGIDMTDEQLAVANMHIDYHRDQFGHGIANVSFQKGYIERLDECDLADNSFDAIVSNCVLNLSTDKAAVLREAYRVLKPGGEFYFSDVYADRRLPDEVSNDPELYGECLGGALYWNDFINLAKSCGFADPRLVEDAPISVDDPRLARLVGNTRFYSATYRLFKLDELEPACEDYGQAVIYRGGIEDSEQLFRLDKHHLIEAGKVFPVCGNTWFMLANTRFSEHFDFIGDFSRHYGIFEGCGTQIPYGGDGTAEGATPCC